MLAAHPAGQAARVPRRLPAVTLIVIRRLRVLDTLKLPGLSRRRRWSPPARPRPRAGTGGAGPIDDRVQQVINGRQRPKGALPGGVSARDGAAPQSCGLALRRSCTGLLPTRRLPRLPPPVAARPPENLARARSNPISSRSAFPRLPGLPTLVKTSPAGRIRQGPSMYEMEGPCPASPHQVGQLAGLPAPRAARRCQVPARGAGLPAPPTFPASHRVVPVSNGESISTASANAAQGPAVNHFRAFPLSTRYPPNTGSYPRSAVVIHRPIHSSSTAAGVTQGTPRPPSPDVIG